MSLRAGSSGHWGGGRCSRRAVPGPGLIAKIFSLRRDLHFAPVDVLLGRGPRTGGDDVRVLQIQPQFKVSQHITIGKRVTTRKIRDKSCWIEYRRQVMHAHEVGGDTTLPPNNALDTYLPFASLCFPGQGPDGHILANVQGGCNPEQ